MREVLFSAVVSRVLGRFDKWPLVDDVLYWFTYNEESRCISGKNDTEIVSHAAKC